MRIRSFAPSPSAKARTALRWLLALPLAAALASCGSGGTPDPDTAIAPEDRALGAQQHAALLQDFGGEYGGPAESYVQGVGERIAAAAGLEGQCTFTLVNTPVVNAFAVPGCYIYVTRGLVAVVTSEAELASVLGHELGHIVGRHAQRQETSSIWRQLGVIAVAVTGSERLTQLANRAAQYFGLRYSRSQEYAADDLSVRYLEAAGYDVYAAADMLEALGRQERFMQAGDREDAARTVPEWALSHPLTERRITRARQEAAETGLAEDALPEDEARYFAAVDGLLFGDDPEQGFVIGRRFAHPAMRISFEAPPGFSLSNSPRAVRLTGPDGISGEFGGNPLPPGGLPRYAEALVAHIVGDAPAEIVDTAPMQVNGLPAIVVQVRLAVRDRSGGNKAVPLAIAVYDGLDGQAYHFIIASPPADGSAQGIAQLFASFRRLSPAEAAALRPRVIRTVRIGAGDTVATLAERTVDPRPAALVSLINGLDQRKLTPGAPAKIVTYARSYVDPAGTPPGAALLP